MSHNPSPPTFKRSSAPKVDEDYKIRISKLIEDFRESELEKAELANLNNHERRYVHELSVKFGLKTKSHGKEPHRVLTLAKPVLDVQHPIRLRLAPVQRQALSTYFTSHPIQPDELEFLSTPGATAPGLLTPTTTTTSSSITKPTTASTPTTAASSSSKPPTVRASQKELPIWEHREEILTCLKEADVTIISGATGSGKSTQTCQYVLDASPEHRVVCTQPRRLAATSLATRVASERGTVLGKECGYSVRFDTQFSEVDTRLLFCTTGVALVKLRARTGLFGRLTHLFLDEIHDRDANSDFLLVFCKEMLARKVKLVLMSATLSIEAFLSYFSDFSCRAVRVQGRSFPVRPFFLEDALRLVHDLPWKSKAQEVTTLPSSSSPPPSSELVCFGCQRSDFESVEAFGQHVVQCSLDKTKEEGVDVWGGEEEEEEGVDVWGDDPTPVVALPPPFELSGKASAVVSTEEQDDGDLLHRYLLSLEDETEVDTSLIVSLLEAVERRKAVDPKVFFDDPSLALSRDAATGVLIFLPGWAEICDLVDLLEQHPQFGDGTRYQVLPLHSSVSPKQQARVFVPTPGVTKIICSTNVAETSLTIPDILLVLDTCLVKEKGYDPHLKTSSLHPSFISRSSAMQRRGRAGRCQQGVCFHLVSELRFSSLAETQVPEILRTPLESLCLQARALLPTSAFSSIASFLSKALDPPSSKSVDTALEALTSMGALSKAEELTGLGRILAGLPMEPRQGRAVLLGCFLECLDSALSLGVSSGFRDPFVLDSNRASISKAHKFALSRSIPQLGASDHVAVLSSIRG